MSGSESCGAETPRESLPTLPEIAAAATLAQLDQTLAENRHAMAMGEAQLRQHLGDNWRKPEDVGITWNSPTIINPEKPRGSGSLIGKLGLAAALLGGGAGLGSAATWLVGRLSSGSAAAVVVPSTDIDTDTQYRLGLGEPDG